MTNTNFKGCNLDTPWTKQDLANAKSVAIDRKRNQYIKEIKNCNWFLSRPEINETKYEAQKAEFIADKAKYEKLLKELI